MTKAKHTQGPWEIGKNEFGEVEVFYKPEKIGRFVIADNIGGEVMVSDSGLYDDYSEVEANAHLISAAPELLAALEGILKANPTEQSMVPAVEIAKAAIAKAKGGAV